MNIISNLPRWAQAPAQQFVSRQEIAGTENSQMDQDSFNSTLQLAAGIVTLAGNDEVEGVDQAMGQPGVVVSEGLTVHFQGNPSAADGAVEAVVIGKDAEAEVAMYVSSSSEGFSALQMAKTGDQVALQGGAVEQSVLGISGYVIAGQVG